MTLTTHEAAELAGLTPASFRRAMSRERAKGRDHGRPDPDRRQMLWDEVGVREWLTARRGTNATIWEGR